MKGKKGKEKIRERKTRTLRWREKKKEEEK